jgi:hypothetical protein
MIFISKPDKIKDIYRANSITIKLRSTIHPEKLTIQ